MEKANKTLQTPEDINSGNFSLVNVSSTSPGRLVLYVLHPPEHSLVILPWLLRPWFWAYRRDRSRESLQTSFAWVVAGLAEIFFFLRCLSPSSLLRLTTNLRNIKRDAAIGQGTFVEITNLATDTFRLHVKCLLLGWRDRNSKVDVWGCCACVFMGWKIKTCN